TRTILQAAGGSPRRNRGENERMNVSLDRARVFFPRRLRVAKPNSEPVSSVQDLTRSRISSKRAPPFWIRVLYAPVVMFSSAVSVNAFRFRISPGGNRTSREVEPNVPTCTTVD